MDSDKTIWEGTYSKELCIKHLKGCISSFDQIPQTGIPYNREAAILWNCIKRLEGK